MVNRILKGRVQSQRITHRIRICVLMRSTFSFSVLRIHSMFKYEKLSFSECSKYTFLSGMCNWNYSLKVSNYSNLPFLALTTCHK